MVFNGRRYFRTEKNFLKNGKLECHRAAVEMLYFGVTTINLAQFHVSVTIKIIGKNQQKCWRQQFT